MIACLAVLTSPVELAFAGNFTSFEGSFSSWRYGEAFFIKASSLDQSAILRWEESRSLVECCVMCAECEPCSGVAFGEPGECDLIDETLAASSFVSSDGSAGDYKVMVYGTNHEDEVNADCKSRLELGQTSDGVYSLNPDNTVPFDAYCDMTNGGWTVIQRRVDDSVDFYRVWDDYVTGFGEPTGNVWAGLGRIHALAPGCDTELYVSMKSFEGEERQRTPTTVASSSGTQRHGYLMTVGGYSGTAGDSMIVHNRMKFTTYVMDQDIALGKNCADLEGAWWYEKCHRTNPNGLYQHGVTTTFGDSVN